MSPVTSKAPQLRPLFDLIFRGDHSFEVVRSRFDREVLYVPPAGPGSTELLVKLYHHRGGLAPVRARFAVTGGLHDWRICRRLAAAGVAVPQPVGGAIWPTGSLRPQSSVFAQHWIQGATPLSKVIRSKETSGQVSEAWVAELCVAIGRFVATIQRWGYFPRDLHPGNLLYEASPSGGFNLLLIDYESTRRRHPFRKSVAHLNLGHICSYLHDLSAEVPERLATAYLDNWPYRRPTDLAAKVRRVAHTHLTRRRRRIDNAFDKIAKARKDVKQVAP